MKTRSMLLAATILASAPLFSVPSFAAAPDEVATLKNENAKLQSELKAMMARLEKVEARAAAIEEKADAAAVTADKAATDASKASADAGQAVTAEPDGSFKLPGTGTKVKLGGYIKVDMLHDLSARPTSDGNSTTADSTDFSSIPTKHDTVLGSRKNANRIDARETRLNLSTETPTEYGPVKTVFEMDFYGAGGNAMLTNSYQPRLRKAYGTFHGFLVGQTWSNFVDVDAIPETLDLGGPAGGSTIRQAQLRYTYDFSNGHSLAASIENSETDFTTQTGASNTNSINRYPDLTAGWRYKADWGHLALTGLLRNVGFDSGKTAAAPSGDKNVWGYGLAASGQWMPFASAKENAYAKDNFFFNAEGGDGIGRYLTEATNLGSFVNSPEHSIKLMNAWGGFAGYQHFWMKSLRSTVAYGHTRIELDKAMLDSTSKAMDSAHANLVWSPITSMDVGAEYIYGRREVKNGDSGEMNRIQGSVTYRF